MKKLKKVAKKVEANTDFSDGVFRRYFLALGAYYESERSHEAFFIMFGPAQFRKEAWAAVREQCKPKMPPSVYQWCDHYFTTGEGLDFIKAFPWPRTELEKMREAMTKMHGENYIEKLT